MKKFIAAMVALFGSTCVLPAALAAEKEKAGAKPERKELRVLATPEAGTRVLASRGEPMEKETVTFLGVETAPASATLAAQLGLPKGSGLVVRTVVPDTPAASVLQPHDILLEFEDQMLIEQRQLSVLIRQRNAGDEITLTFLRAGKQTTAKVKLGTHEVPKVSGWFEMAEPGAHAFAFGFPGERVELATPPAGGPANVEEVDHLLRLIQRGPGVPDVPLGHGGIPPATRVYIDREHGPGFRAMTVNPGNSNLVFSDDQGSLELTIKDGQKKLVAKDASGAELFSGPATTPDERAAIPEGVRVRLEELEGMRDVTFETDEEFRGSETKIVRPLGRGASLPLPGRRWSTARRPLLL